MFHLRYENEDGEIVESDATENASMDANITFKDAEQLSSDEFWKAIRMINR